MFDNTSIRRGAAFLASLILLLYTAAFAFTGETQTKEEALEEALYEEHISEKTVYLAYSEFIEEETESQKIQNEFIPDDIYEQYVRPYLASIQEAEATESALVASIETPEPSPVPIQPTEAPVPKKPTYGYVNANELNVRSGPSADDQKLSTLTRGSRVEVLSKNGEWSKVITKDGKEGYLLGKFLVASSSSVARAPEPAASYNGDMAASIIEYAKKLQGVPYVYGGSTTKGFDCSGFTQYVFKKFGIKLPRSSSEYSSVGVKVARTDLKPGDILLFDRHDNHRLGHVGIYLGGDKFIHASTYKGKVIIMTLSEYKGNYLGARRVIK